MREKCDQIENVISDKMVELELSGRDGGIVVNGMRIFCIKGYLFIRTPEVEDFFEEYRVIHSGNSSGEYVLEPQDDMCFTYSSCSNKHALRFLNNAVAIIEKLGEIEQEKVDAISKALEATEKL